MWRDLLARCAPTGSCSLPTCPASDRVKSAGRTTGDDLGTHCCTGDCTSSTRRRRRGPRLGRSRCARPGGVASGTHPATRRPQCRVPLVDVRAAWHMPTASLPGVPEVAFRVGGARAGATRHRTRVAFHRPLADDLMAHYVAATPIPHVSPRCSATTATTFGGGRGGPSRGGWAGRSASVPVCRGQATTARPPTTPSLRRLGCSRSGPPECVRASVVRDLGDCRCVVIPRTPVTSCLRRPRGRNPGDCRLSCETDGLGAGRRGDRP